MNAHRLRQKIGAVFLFACLTFAAAGCGQDDDSIPNQSAAAQAIRVKVEADLEKARLNRIAPRLARAVAAAAAAPSASIAPPSAADPSVKAVVRPAAELYATNCSSCHGPKGGGDGPLSAGLVPKPAKHADGVYMNALSNDHIFKVIKEGGASVGKAATMAPWGPSMSDDEIHGLVAFLRTLATPAYVGPMP